MTRHDNLLRVRHMLDHAVEAVDMVKGRHREELDEDRQLALSLTRLIEIVGEAAGRVSTKTREQSPAIPWVGVIGMRNRLIHGYDQVDLDILWAVVCHDLPPLIRELEKILAAGGEG